jgi:aryl-phospho-beta-D-glucosidase BglC (GH1 family)
LRYLTSHVLGAQRHGVNLVSMNLGGFNRATGPVRESPAGGANYPVYPAALLDWMQTSHMTSVRLLFTWEAVQPALGGPIPPPPPPAAARGYSDYWADLLDVLRKLLARNIYVTLAPWQYGSASGDTDILYDDAPFTPADFGDFWAGFAAAINAATLNDPRVAFDLINEPHQPGSGKPGDHGISTVAWFACAQQAITAIRAKGVANTILVPGMNFADCATFVASSAASWLTLNDPLNNIAVTVHQYNGLGSSSPTVLSATCADVVIWARSHGLRLHVGEIAIDAGQPMGLLATAQQQWADWNRFCVENSDVIVGWNWWAVSEDGWWSTADSSGGSNWGLTLDDGATPSRYMTLVASTIPVPRLVIVDDAADTGAEPNATTVVGWESPAISATQGGSAIIRGGSPCTVTVNVTNLGNARYDPSYGHIVRLYWAKAGAGLGWPEPWNGRVGGVVPPLPIPGEPLPPAVVPAIAVGATQPVTITWTDTPDPAAYPVQDGHFCLLAFALPPHEPEFNGSEAPTLNGDVLRFGHIAWHNLHIMAVGAMQMGSLVASNHTRRAMRAQVSFDVLDEHGRPLPRDAGALVVTPSVAALERMRRHPIGGGGLEEVGPGTFRVLDTAAGLPALDLEPGESLAIAVAYAPARESGGCAIRAIQSVDDGSVRTIVGGQTFVAGTVAGFSGGSAGTRTTSGRA